MKQHEEELKSITPQLNDKLKVIAEIMHESLRDEDLDLVPKLVAIEKNYRTRKNSVLPVEPKEERREENLTTTP